MEKGQFAILRFAKYKGPEIGRIEAHNERTKEEYASKYSEVFSRFITLHDAKGSAKEYIENCQKQLEELQR